MKQLKDFKMLFRLLFFGILLTIPMYFVSAETAEDLQNKINSKNTEIEKLERAIAGYQRELQSLGSQKTSLASAIKTLDLTRKKLNADIAVTETKISKTNLKIESLSSQIGTKEDSIDKAMEAIIIDIKKTDESEKKGLVEVLISKQSFTDLWNEVEIANTVRAEINKNIILLKTIKGELEDTREETLEAKKLLTDLRSELADQKKIVEQNKAEKDKLLKQTKNNEANYQKILKTDLAKKEAFEKELRDYESQLKFILDPKSLPKSGVLSWPLDSVYVTQLFGKTSASARLYASGSHSGVDFGATVGTRVLAMADGTVLGTGDTDSTCAGASFGKWVYIDHGNGLGSTYGHLSLVKASSGQKVTRGEVIGYSGATGRVTGPHLHVTVYASKAVEIKSLPSKSCKGKSLYQPFAAVNAYLDPMYYLPPYKR